MRVIVDDALFSAHRVQYRHPTSKKKRIIKKFFRDKSNWRDLAPAAGHDSLIVGNTLIVRGDGMKLLKQYLAQEYYCNSTTVDFSLTADVEKLPTI